MPLDFIKKVCEYCGKEYSPYKTDSIEVWEKRKYCRSICEANAKAKKPKEFGFNNFRKEREKLKAPEKMYLFMDERACDEDGYENATCFFMAEDLKSLKREIKESGLLGFIWQEDVVIKNGKNYLENGVLVEHISK